MGSPGHAPSQALQQLEKVLASEVFRSAARSSKLLRYLVESAVNGQADRLKEYTIGADALGRGEAFDPRIDSIARVEISRLRSRLDQYYATEGRDDALVIVLPKGSYVPLLQTRPPAEPPLAPRPRRSLWVAVTIGALCVALAVAWLMNRPAAATMQPLLKLEVELRSDGRLGSVVGTHAVISPDGSRIAFVASDSQGVSHLYVKPTDGAETERFGGTDGARGPFFSPDGQWVGFWAAGKVWKAPVTGGSPILLCESVDLLGASWGDDGKIIAVLNPTSQLLRIPGEGGVPAPVEGLTGGPQRVGWPQVLPGSRAVLFTAVAAEGADGSSIDVWSFREQRRKTLVRGATFGRYLQSGHLAYVNQGTVYVVAFDLQRLEIRGTAVAMLSDVEYSPVFGFAQVDFARNGTGLYRRSLGHGQSTIHWLDSSGNQQPVVPRPGAYLWPTLSPDGRRIAFTRVDSGHSAVWIADTQTGRLSPLSPAGTGTQITPIWSPDGRSVFFREGGSLTVVSIDGSGRQTLLERGQLPLVPWSFAPGGTRLAYHALSSGTHFDLWTVPLENGGTQWRAGRPEPFLQTKAVETYPAFSPDGRWIAYTSNQTGSFEVYVRAFPDTGKVVQVSSGGGRVVRWSRKGNQLFYATDDQRVLIVPYEVKNGIFESGRPRPWLTQRLADTGVLANFDVAPDGSRILALMPVSDPGREQAANHVTFLVNFFDEVRRHVPAR